MAPDVPKHGVALSHEGLRVRIGLRAEKGKEWKGERKEGNGGKERWG